MDTEIKSFPRFQPFKVIIYIVCILLAALSLFPFIIMIVNSTRSTPEIQGTAVSLIPSVLVFAYYRWVSYSKFGGITGDLAGWFLQKCELYILLCAAACAMFLK